MIRTRKVLNRISKKNWEKLSIINSTNTLYKHFIKIHSNIFEKNLLLLETEVKLNDL